MLTPSDAARHSFALNGQRLGRQTLALRLGRDLDPLTHPPA